MEDGARVVVIDSLNGYMNAMPEDAFTISDARMLTFLNQQALSRCW
jgi:circadian clock protein KaiC